MTEKEQSQKSSNIWQWIRKNDAGLPFIKYIMLIISAVALAMFLLMSYFLYQLGVSSVKVDIDSFAFFRWLPVYGNFGSFMAGTLGTATAAFGILLLYVNLRVQMTELAKSNSVLKETAGINQKALLQQKKLAKEEAIFQKKTFLMSQIDKQLDRTEEEIKSIRQIVYSSGSSIPNGSMKISTSCIFGPESLSESQKMLVKEFDKSKIEEYLTRLSLMSHDVIQFLELEGKYHHRASLFDEIMLLLNPFRYRVSEIVESLSPLDINPYEFWILDHAEKKIAELRSIQENNIKNNLIIKKAE